MEMKNTVLWIAALVLFCTVAGFLWTAKYAAADEDLSAIAGGLWWRGEYGRAAARYEEAAGDRDSEWAGRLQLAALYRSVGRYGRAVEQYKTLLENRDLQAKHDPVARADGLFVPLGESLYYTRRLEAGEAAFRRALDLHPDSVPALFGLGRILLAQNRLEEAELVLRRAAVSNPKFPGNFIYLARIAERRANPALALSYYERALETDGQQAELLFSVGRLHESLGSVEDAFRQFHRLRSIDRKNPLVIAKIEELRPLLTRAEEEVIPVKTLGRFKPGYGVPGASEIPAVRVGLGTDSGGRMLPLSSVTIVANGAFTVEADEAVYFTGAPRTDYRIELHEDGPRIRDLSGGEPSPLPDRFVMRIDSLRDGRIEREAFIIRRIEYARGYAWAGIEDRQYRGELLVRAGSDGFRLVNEINLEEYLYSVVPSEMGISYPQEALKAQAIIARSYALYRKRIVRPHRNDGFDLCDSQHCQVYRGGANEWRRTTAAVDGTRGMILVHGDKPASPLFHANCGGHTQSSGELKGWSDVEYLHGVLDGGPDLAFPGSPAALERWLKTVPPAYCSSPRFNAGPEFRWFRLIPASLLEEKLNRRSGIGELKSITVVRRNTAGYVNGVLVSGARGSLLIEKEHEIRRLLGVGPLRSNLFWLETDFDQEGEPVEFVFYGGGWGHGVGLCQDGAGGMAELGRSYRDILLHYYRGATLKSMDY
jgi:SpoIID/LytB domain protein